MTLLDVVSCWLVSKLAQCKNAIHLADLLFVIVVGKIKDKDLYLNSPSQCTSWRISVTNILYFQWIWWICALCPGYFCCVSDKYCTSDLINFKWQLQPIPGQQFIDYFAAQDSWESRCLLCFTCTCLHILYTSVFVDGTALQLSPSGEKKYVSEAGVHKLQFPCNTWQIVWMWSQTLGQTVAQWHQSVNINLCYTSNQASWVCTVCYLAVECRDFMNECEWVSMCM